MAKLNSSLPARTAARRNSSRIDLKVNLIETLLMKKSTESILVILQQLELKARALGLTDTEWAGRAGIRKETLSRLRGRQSCDFATLQALAAVVGASLGILRDESPELSAIEGVSRPFPSSMDRPYEDELIYLCASRDIDIERWRQTGNSFFMGGIAVMLASVPGFDRRTYLELGERLHEGMSQVGVFALWLERSPLRPSRFLPMVSVARRHAA